MVSRKAAGLAKGLAVLAGLRELEIVKSWDNSHVSGKTPICTNQRPQGSAFG
jgi:hypothetical protein